jgi:hypothetical protein
MSLADINPQIDPASNPADVDAAIKPATNGNGNVSSLKDTAVNSKVCIEAISLQEQLLTDPSQSLHLLPTARI